MCYLKTILSLFFLTGFVFSIPATAQERQSDEGELASSTMLPAENEPSENASLGLPAAEIPDEYKNMTLEKAGISATANKEAKKKKTKNQFKPDEEYLLQGLTLEHKVAQMLMVSVDAVLGCTLFYSVLIPFQEKSEYTSACNNDCRNCLRQTFSV